MIKEFSTFGSCSSRNIFTDASNKGYKNFYHINFSLEDITLISLMSQQVKFDEKLLNSPNKYANYCVYHDFKKHEFLDFIKTNIDYLVIDTYYDVLIDVIIVNENTYISNSKRLRSTDLSKLYENHERINIQNDFDRYLKIWTDSCDNFFNFINNNCRCKVILNCSRPVYRFFSKKDNGIIESNYLKKMVPMYHEKFRDILDTYIIKNFDVNVLPFDYSTLADENHPWSLHPTHYEQRYYREKTKQINNIIKLNESFDSNSINIKLNEKNNLINTFKENRLKEFEYKKNMGVYESLSKYLTARFDIKNKGNVSNTLQLLEISDNNASIIFPQWLSDINGEGLSIRSYQGKLKLKIKCIHDGKLIMRLMGMDIRNDSGNRVPIYIRFTDFAINGKKIIKNDEIISHDNPFLFTKRVKDSEILLINASWKMF